MMPDFTVDESDRRVKFRFEANGCNVLLTYEGATEFTFEVSSKSNIVDEFVEFANDTINSGDTDMSPEGIVRAILTAAQNCLEGEMDDDDGWGGDDVPNEYEEDKEMTEEVDDDAWKSDPEDDPMFMDEEAKDDGPLGIQGLNVRIGTHQNIVMFKKMKFRHDAFQANLMLKDSMKGICEYAF